MFLAMVRAMLGPLGWILDWAEANPDTVALAFGAWTILWFAGNAQFRHIKSQTRRLVQSKADDVLARRPGLGARKLYEEIYPSWEASLSRWALFIPHRLEMWPVPASAKIVQERMGFSPEWIQEELKRGALGTGRRAKPSNT